jgi:hypothetical protein
VEDEDSFTFNDDFVAPLFRIKVNCWHLSMHLLTGSLQVHFRLWIVHLPEQQKCSLHKAGVRWLLTDRMPISLVYAYCQAFLLFKLCVSWVSNHQWLWTQWPSSAVMTIITMYESINGHLMNLKISWVLFLCGTGQCYSVEGDSRGEYKHHWASVSRSPISGRFCASKIFGLL